jgi:hypothetical protein
MVEELIKEFTALTDEEKLRFFKPAMPSLKEIFSKDSQVMMQGMMQGMMPIYREMMSACGMDMNEMMRMMGKFGKR